MEECDVIDKAAENKNADGKAYNGRFRDRLTDIVRRLILFICCGPGVLGFLWLIGRILRR